LKHLVLSNNELTGTIPTSLSRCSNLVKFKVDHNFLTGTMPEEIVPSWSNSIVNFNVGSNILTGTIPENIGFWNKTRFFAIDANQVNGTIPTTIQNWTNVTNVHFENNQLSGTIPAQFCSFVLQSDTPVTVTVDQDKVDCACCDYQNITMYVP
jgi:Leucine-rich repeat (LRR) protein